MRYDILEKKDLIIGWINENQSKSFICKELKCKPITLDSYLVKLNLDYKGNQGGKGIKCDPNYKTALEYIESGAYISSHKLRQKLFKDKIKEKKCEECGVTEWNNKKLEFELHHKDGNHYNNELTNLIILCPNCHSQTDTHSKRK
jgi:Zn finger protein HypA/HybF involved in hydrogenase expression